MPTQSLIIGVDLAPIRPIPKAITFQGDITTDKCRATIRQYLKTWKADTVLHDGAPNVGVAWVQDAYSQAELVLQSLKLATEFLALGGTFVTKVFRSKDYNPLLWVFKQLFTTVEATKPPSSRSVSAEIFVVCRGFKAPKHIDRKFLDPRHVFAELQDPTPNHEVKVFNPEKRKRKREGYDEGDYTQHKEIPVSEFINTTDPIAVLATYNRLSFQQSLSGDLALATLERLPETTDEIRACCEDLKVLGRKEFRSLLRWRRKVRDKFGLSWKEGLKKLDEGNVTEVVPMDDELAIQEELQRLREQESSRKKKKRRKENERRQKEIVRLQMHMITPTEIGMEQTGPAGEESMFALKPINKDGAVDTIASGKIVSSQSDDEGRDMTTSIEETDEEEDRLERELDLMYEKYQESLKERDTKLRAKKARTEFKTEEWEGFSHSGQSSNGEATDHNTDSLRSGIDLEIGGVPKSSSLSNNAALFFDQEIFHHLGVSEDSGGGGGSDSSIEVESDEETPKNLEDNEVVQAIEKPGKSPHTSHLNDRELNSVGHETFGDRHATPDDPRKQNGRLGKSQLILSRQNKESESP
jgi:AdoMet-dependent rRNA methyltransferase SPB1